jgi:hypothetical protein
MRFVPILACLPLAACGMSVNGNDHASANAIPPTGSGGERSWQVADFTGVALRGSDDVEVRYGTAFSVRAEGDSDVLDKIEIEKVGSVLRIGRKNRNWNWNSDDGVRVFVTLPRLTNASVSGSGDLTADRAEGDFAGSVAGSGDLSVAALNGGTAKLSVAGSGDLTVIGTATSLDLSVAGSGDIDASALKATGATVSIAGSGNIRAQVSGDARVSIAGSGDVELAGGAKCTISKVGSGEVRCI